MERDVLLNVLEEIAPLALAEEWDNSGMQIDTGKKEVERILVALEITERVIDEAVREKCGMIVCHHPLLFVPVRRIAPDFTVGHYILRLIKEGISVYAAHTCFDKAP